MHIKALFLDLDGTSLNSDQQLSPRLVSALTKLHRHGVEIVFCTGRGFTGTKLFLEQLGICNYVVNFNSARILDLKRDELLYEAILDPQIVEQTFTFAHQHNIAPNFYHNDVFYTKTVDNDLLYYRELTGEQYHVFTTPHEITNLAVTKAVYIVPESSMEYLSLQATNFFPAASVYSSSDTYLEIMPKDVTKAFGVNTIIQKIGIKPEECMAFGDQWNDYDMLKFVGKGFIMNNAPEALKARFSQEQHALTNDCDGVAIQLEKHFNLSYE